MKWNTPTPRLLLLLMTQSLTDKKPTFVPTIGLFTKKVCAAIVKASRRESQPKGWLFLRAGKLKLELRSNRITKPGIQKRKSAAVA
jgi:hypothetical protein